MMKMNRKIRKLVTAAVEAECFRCVAAVEAEPEFWDEMPDDMWTALRSDKAVAVEALRLTVRLTKRGIMERLLKGRSSSGQHSE